MLTERQKIEQSRDIYILWYKHYCIKPSMLAEAVVVDKHGSNRPHAAQLQVSIKYLHKHYLPWENEPNLGTNFFASGSVCQQLSYHRSQFGAKHSCFPAKFSSWISELRSSRTRRTFLLNRRFRIVSFPWSKLSILMLLIFRWESNFLCKQSRPSLSLETSVKREFPWWRIGCCCHWKEESEFTTLSLVFFTANLLVYNNWIASTSTFISNYYTHQHLWS